MSQKFQEIYDSIAENELDFLLEFMFQLTILGRQIAIDFEGENRVQAFKQLNELNHRTLNRARVIGVSDPWCTKKYLSEYVVHHVGLAPYIEAGVNYAAVQALSKLNA